MASSMTTSTVAATVKSIHQCYINGTKYVNVHCTTTPDATTKANMQVKVGAVGGTGADFDFVVIGTSTAPAVGDTFSIVIN